MTKNVLTQNATEEEIKEWLKLKDKRVEVDPGNPTNITDKINQVIKEQIKKSSNDDSDNTPTGNGDDNTKVVISKNDQIRTVKIDYHGAVSSTSWTVKFDLDKGQRLDQQGFNDLLRKIVSDHVIYDADQGSFWIYDSKRWIRLSPKSEDLRQFVRQAVNIVIQNVQLSDVDIRYDVEQ